MKRKPLKTRLYKSQVLRGEQSLWNEAWKCRKVAECCWRHLGIETRGTWRRFAHGWGSGSQRATKMREIWGWSDEVGEGKEWEGWEEVLTA